MKDLNDLKSYIEEAQYQLDLAEERRQSVEEYCEDLEEKLDRIKDITENDDLIDLEKIGEIKDILEE